MGLSFVRPTMGYMGVACMIVVRRSMENQWFSEDRYLQDLWNRSRNNTVSSTSRICT
jgi:hypothetical protein